MKGRSGQFQALQAGDRYANDDTCSALCFCGHRTVPVPAEMGIWIDKTQIQATLVMRFRGPPSVSRDRK